MRADGPESRTCQVLSKLMPGVEQERMEGLLAGRRVNVAIGAEAAADPSGQLIATFVVNLLARLYPVVQDLVVSIPKDERMRVRIPLFGMPTLVGTMDSIVKAVGGRVRGRLESALPAADVQISIGEVESRAPITFFVSNNGWIARVSREMTALEPRVVNPVGSYAAATFGVAQVWNALLLPHKQLLKDVALHLIENDFVFSTFDYLQREDGPNPELPQIVDLGKLTLAGIGAGGSSWIFTMASFREVRGNPNLIEHDQITASNPQRYVIASEKDAVDGILKVDRAIQCFRGHSGVVPNRIALPYGEGAQTLSVDDRRIVVAQVHSRSARWQVQQDTPRVLLDGAASERGEFVVRRIAFGRSACLGCEYPPEGNPELAAAKQHAAIFGLPLSAFYEKIRDNAAYTESELAIMRAYPRTGDAATIRLPDVGEKHADWARSLCGKIRISELEEEVPIPQAPVLVGVLLAGEVLKELYFPNSVLDSYFHGTVIGRISPRVQVHRRPPRADCSICSSKILKAQFVRSWGVTG